MPRKAAMVESFRASDISIVHLKLCMAILPYYMHSVPYTEGFRLGSEVV